MEPSEPSDLPRQPTSPSQPLQPPPYAPDPFQPPRYGPFPGGPVPPPPPPYGYPPPMPPYIQVQVVTQPTNGLAVTSMVLGIISLVGVLTILASTCAVPLGILGLIFGIVGYRRPYGQGMAMAGIVMNGIVSALALIVVAIFGLGFLGLLLGIFGISTSH